MAIEKWKFDATHSNVGFSVRHLMISKVHGRFGAWTGSLTLDEENHRASSVEVEIDTGSIDTKDPQRDEHLRSADFFDVTKFPKIAFKSSRVEKVDGQEYKVTGNLTINGVTKEITLDVEYFGRQKDPWGGERIGFNAKTSIDRKTFGLVFNMPLEGGGVVVGDKVEITLDVEAVKETAAAAV
jgi:polyisoprenoid-binding protein YceI